MADERWVVQLASAYLWDVWNHIGPVYVSEEVANLAIEYHWAEERPAREFRVRRVR